MQIYVNLLEKIAPRRVADSKPQASLLHAGVPCNYIHGRLAAARQSVFESTTRLPLFFYTQLTKDILTHIFFSYTIQTLHGDIAQLVEHTAHIRAVIGPSPIVPIKPVSLMEQAFSFIKKYSC